MLEVVQEGFFVTSLNRITEEIFAASVPFYTLRADRADIVVADAFAYGTLMVFAVVGRFAVLGVDGGQR